MDSNESKRGQYATVLSQLKRNAKTDHVLAPYVSTPLEVIPFLISCACITEKDIVVDIGCGDCNVLCSVAEKTAAQCIGMDIDEDAIHDACIHIQNRNLSHLVRCLHTNALVADYDWSSVSVVILYLTVAGLKQLYPFLLSNLNHGTRLICIQFRLPDHPCEEFSFDYVDTRGKPQTFGFYKYDF